MSLLMSLYAVLFFPRDVLDGIWNLIGSVSEGFPTYLFTIWYALLLQQLDNHAPVRNKRVKNKEVTRMVHPRNNSNSIA